MPTFVQGLLKWYASGKDFNGKSWAITWNWEDFPEEWAVSKNWWKGHLIIQDLLYLKGLGDLTKEALITSELS